LVNGGGKNREDFIVMWNKSNLLKELTLPSIQNLKIMSLWVFFLRCCSTFSLLFYVRLILMIGFLTTSLSNESLIYTSTSPSSRSIFKHEHLTNNRYLYCHSYNGTRLPETSIRKTFNIGIKLYSSKSVTATNHQLWYHLLSKSRRKIVGVDGDALDLKIWWRNT